jgi:hypothetical protein
LTTLRRRRANRKNARASTGPKSTAGKTRSARNARRHGLAVPIWADPQFAADIEALAERIAGPDAHAETLICSRRVAEAHVDLTRVHQTRRDLIESGFELYSPREQKNLPGRDRKKLDRTGGSPEKLAFVLSDLSKQLNAIERYERRALSRRKFAIRDLDATRRWTVQP